jgi:oligopeptide/dipeptide ABC transporter ATP-binding protein
MSSKVLALRDLHVVYRTAWRRGTFNPFAPRPQVRAVNGVSLDVAAGETVAVIGESGCGKSTLARAALRMQPLASGEIEWFGHDVVRSAAGALRSLRRNVGVVWQDPFSSLDPRMRVEQIVGEPLIPENGVTRAMVRDRVREALQLVGLRRDSATLYPHEFSGGQRQRIAIARALVTTPKFILLDEPVSALDVSIRAQILNLLKRLQDELGLAYIMISHDLAAARYLATRLAVMYCGKLVETGACEAVYTEPLHPYTEALLSAALPLHPSARRQRIILKGEVPNPTNPPAGCRFHPRCPKAMTECASVEPAWREVKPGRFAACHLH